MYIMHTNYLPQHICNELDRINRNFLWGDTSEKRRVHLVNWEEVCTTKEKGGLGLREAQHEPMNKRLWPPLYDSTLPGDSLTHYKQLMGVFFAKQQAKGRSPKQLIRFRKDLSIRQIHQRSRSNERREVLIQPKGLIRRSSLPMVW